MSTSSRNPFRRPSPGWDLTGLARRPNQRGSQLGRVRLTFILAIHEALPKGPDLCTVLRKPPLFRTSTAFSMGAIRLPLSRTLFPALAGTVS